MMDIAQRTARSTAYTVTASIIQTGVQFVRSIILARLLDVDVFGIYAFAASWIVATRAVGQFGLRDALLHRAQESEGENALRVHFTLSLIFSTLWAAALLAVSPFIIPSAMPSETLTVLWILIAAEFFAEIPYTANSLLVKRVVFRRIALINVSVTVASTAAALILAWKGFGIWSLVATDIVRAVVVIVGYHIYRPVWRPRFAWSKGIVRYFVGFGRRSFLAGLLLQALDQVDDLWTGFFLGDTALGYYSRAYRFATYPRSILASPLNNVASGTYAELKDKPKRLAQAFFRINALLIRTGFLLAGLLALIAPEFIRIVIGSKWLPMLTAFRLMLVFTLLDPIKATVASLFVAVGQPEKTVRARLIQLGVMVIGLFTLGNIWGIEGVALAVDVMLVVGIGLLLWQARAHIQFSIWRLFAAPAFALALGMAAARAAIEIPGIRGSAWRTGGVKAAVFAALYVLLMLLLEKELIPMARSIVRQVVGRGQGSHDE